MGRTGHGTALTLRLLLGGDAFFGRVKSIFTHRSVLVEPYGGGYRAVNP